MRPRRTAVVVATTISVAAVAFLALRPRDRWAATTLETVIATPTLDARRVRLSRGDTAFEATVFRFDRNGATAALADVAEGQTLADVAGGATLAINAGYFDAAFAPLGLYRVGGRAVSPMLDRSPLSGVVTIDAVGRLDLGTRDDPAAPSAFQAGPFLIDPGGTLGIRGEDGKLAERTVLALDGRSVAVIVTTPATLRAVAECLHDRPNLFGLTRCDRALNLDGGPSTGFALNAAGVHRAVPPRGRIRSALRFDLVTQP